MNFLEAYEKMLNGKHVKRKTNNVEWYIDSFGRVIIELEDGAKIVNESKNLRITLNEIAQEDWEVVNGAG